MKQPGVSRATMGRIPQYLAYLESICAAQRNISATSLAKALGLGEVQVRKDLNAVSGAGRPKTGYYVQELIAALQAFLGGGDPDRVVIVGAGRLGRALLGYPGFAAYGLEILAAFDIAVRQEEKSGAGKPVYPMERLDDFCRAQHVRIGIITVPAQAAQTVCDRLVKNGVKAIWCFAPCMLTVPEDIAVQYENMALSLAYLRKKI